MKRLTFVGVLLILMATPAIAQSAPAPAASVSVKPGDPIRLAWNYDAASLAARPVQFRLYIDGVVAVNFKSTDVTSSVDATGATTFTTNSGVVAAWTAQQRGTHLYELAAYDAESESAKASLPIVVGFGVAPAPPTGLRPYTVQGTVGPNGEVTLVFTPQGGGQ
jgi:hypothetical protein